MTIASEADPRRPSLRELARGLRTLIAMAVGGAGRTIGRFAGATMVMVSASALVEPIALGAAVDALVDGQGAVAWAWMAVWALLTFSSAAVYGIWERAAAVMNIELWHRLHHGLLRAACAPPGIAHLESPAYADRASMVRTYASRVYTVVHNGIFQGAYVVIAVVGTWVLAGIHPGLVVLLSLALVVASLEFRAGRRRQRLKRDEAASQRLAGRLQQLATAPSAAAELRMLGTLPVLLRHHDAATRDVLRKRQATAVNGALVGGASTVANTVILAGGFLLIIIRAVNGEITPGEVATGVALLRTTAGIVLQMAHSAGVTYESGLVGLELLELIEHETEVRAPEQPVAVPSTVERGIRLRGVEFTYPGMTTPVLRDIDLALPAGTTIALVGDNGAGKSTLVKLLLRLYDPTEGAIEIDGADLRTFDPDEWRAGCTAAFQDHLNPQFLAREVIGIGSVAHLDDEVQVAAAAATAGADTVVQKLPRGLGTQLGRTWTDGHELSRGQWQKLALARATMRTAPLLVLLDEPTASLDPRAEHDLFERYVSAAEEARERGGITVLVSHRFSTVRMADLIVVLEQGQIVEVGTHDELQQRGGRYAEAFSIQAAAYVD